jgi:hypothetical protein
MGTTQDHRNEISTTKIPALSASGANHQDIFCGSANVSTRVRSKAWRTITYPLQSLAIGTGRSASVFLAGRLI